jgi:hypothetical protein
MAKKRSRGGDAGNIFTNRLKQGINLPGQLKVKGGIISADIGRQPGTGYFTRSLKENEVIEHYHINGCDSFFQKMIRNSS